MITGVEHIAVFAKDTKALAEWYVRVFGFKIVFDNGEGLYFVAAPDKTMIEICKAQTDITKPATTDSGIRHIAFTSDNIDEDARRLVEDEGVEVVSPLKKSDAGIGSFFFRDIEGNIMHLIQRTNPLI